MQHIYKPEAKEEDAGYSIPKILVAVLFLFLIGAGVYIYFQKRKLKTSVTYLIDEKKQTEKDLNEIIEKYNLAIDDNDNLEGDLVDERDFIIKYRDSISNVKDKDLKQIDDYKKKLSELKETRTVQFKEVLRPVASPLDAISNTKKTTSVQNEENTSEEQSPFSEAATLNKDTTSIDENKAAPVAKSTTFNRVETPPIYPGCNRGTPTQKKVCFTKKIKKHLYRRFDATIIGDLNLSPGKKRIWLNFNIDKFGNVVNVKAKAPKDMSSKAKIVLEEEAIQVIKKLPKMTAAIQNGKAVQISYSVPLTLVVPE